MRVIKTGIIMMIWGILVWNILAAWQPIFAQSNDWLLPVSTADRKTWRSIQLTSIGMFGLRRKPRSAIPSHLHTGIDIERPNNNYQDEPIYPMFTGKVISLRDDGPFAQIIISHKMPTGSLVWTVYEHVAGIAVSLDDRVSPHVPIARFMNKTELDKFGWQFNHLHFEVLKHAPRLLKPTPGTPQRRYGTYSLKCYTETELDRYYYNPIEFVKARWADR